MIHVGLHVPVRTILNPDSGLWVLEQSYVPLNVARGAHSIQFVSEHLSCYGMSQLKYIMDKAGLKIIDIEMNDVNGGSFFPCRSKKE